MLRPATFCLLLALASACASTPEDAATSDRGWLRASPRLKEQIEDQISRLPWTHGVERVEQIQWFAGIGEPAYERLLELCVDPRADVAASAVAALGATRDSRLVEPLRALDWPESDDRALRFEKARTFLRLGDWSELGVLVEGLGDASVWARSWCAQALKEATGQDLGFDPRGDDEQRAVALAKWREWMAARQGEGILASANASNSQQR